jgi:hypothetical protein
MYKFTHFLKKYLSKIDLILSIFCADIAPSETWLPLTRSLSLHCSTNSPSITTKKKTNLLASGDHKVWSYFDLGTILFLFRQGYLSKIISFWWQLWLVLNYSGTHISKGCLMSINKGFKPHAYVSFNFIPLQFYDAEKRFTGILSMRIAYHQSL